MECVSEMITEIKLAWELAKIQVEIEDDLNIPVIWLPFKKELYFFALLIGLIYLRFREMWRKLTNEANRLESKALFRQRRIPCQSRADGLVGRKGD